MPHQATIRTHHAPERAVRVIARDGEHGIEIQRSRFVCTVARVGTVEAAASAIDRVRRAGPDATHHCTALRIGDPATGDLTARSSDDGEPSGTAGVPMLEVLARRGLTDVVAVVSRWFGGARLGAGGLVRAYSGVLAETLDLVGELRRVRHRELLLAVPHDRAGRLEHDLRHSPYRLCDVEHGADVTLTVAVAEGDLAGFDAWLAAHTGGSVEALDAGPRDLDLP